MNCRCQNIPTYARITLYLIAALLIAAHFLRAGNLVLTGLCLATPGLFFVRRRWSQLLLQGLAWVAAACWLWIAWELVAMRQATGQPWLLAAGILLGVASLTALAGALAHQHPAWSLFRKAPDEK